MKNKVYVLIKCKIISFWEHIDCASEIYEPEVIGVYQTLGKLKRQLKELDFSEESIKYFLDLKLERSDDNYNFYFLKEIELS